MKYLDYFRPKAFLFENVVGIMSMKTDAGEKVIDIIMNLLSANYDCVKAILYASDYEVPQNRRRVYIVGWARAAEVQEFAWPRPYIATLLQRV